jgi:2-polyprenyl-3-methyl-5-hydroxy-6-metoxy-1,4-benzoquinol methylase
MRKFSHNPRKILGAHIKEGMNILDFGCAMGYFSLPLARMTGVKGNVYCTDIQEKMLEKLQKRADKAGLGQIIKTRLVGKTYKTDELQNQIDFAMLFFVAHEVSDQVNLFKDLFKMIKPGGKVLFAEPKGHVTTDDFENSLQLAKSAGFMVSEEKPIPRGLSAFLLK